jgi:radical SAM/Cys-rich protein
MPFGNIDMVKSTLTQAAELSNPIAAPPVTSFDQKLGQPLAKQSIRTLQINLGRRCNLACTHCHVEAGPKRTEELSPEVCEQLLQVIQRFPQIETIDLTGGAPEMNYGFRPLVEAARAAGKSVIVRSNLTIFFEPGFEDLPDYLAAHQVRVVASLPCYLQDNVDRQRGTGVYAASIRALQCLNHLGYGNCPELILDLVYNPALPSSDEFSLSPNQQSLEQAYKVFLAEQFDIVFDHLLTITNLPVGRTRQYLERRGLALAYLQFLEANFNAATVSHLMCRNELSVDYRGNIYDCDFNQMADLPALAPHGKPLTIATLLEADNLDLIQTIRTATYCYGCTAGSGSSCGGALL